MANEKKKQARRVEEIIYVVPEEREAYLESHLNPPERIQQIMWMHGMRKQFYFSLNDMILMSFEYVGKDRYGADDGASRDERFPDSDKKKGCAGRPASDNKLVGTTSENRWNITGKSNAR